MGLVKSQFNLKPANQKKQQETLKLTKNLPTASKCQHSCKVTLYVDANLFKNKLPHFEKHLSACDHCQEVLEVEMGKKV